MSRLRTTGWFVLILMGIAILIGPSFTEEDPVSRPTSDDRRSAGLAGFTQWLNAAKIPVVSIRTRFDDFLPNASLPATGNLAILHIPATLTYEAEEIQTLNQWVAQGNSLLVLSGYLESTAWIYSGNSLNRTAWRLTGLHFHPVEEGEKQGESEGGKEEGVDDENEALNEHEENENSAEIEAVFEALDAPGWQLLHGARHSTAIEVVVPHPVFGGLPILQAPWDSARWEPIPSDPPQADSSEDGAQEVGEEEVGEENDGEQLNAGEVNNYHHTWRSDAMACADYRTEARHFLSGQDGCIEIPIPDPNNWRTILAHRDRPQAALLENQLGAGKIWLLLHPSLLDNEIIHRFENRQFAMALVDHALFGSGAVLLDDAHHGLNDIVEVDDLLIDQRFWATIGFLLLFWLGYLLADSGLWQRTIHRAEQKHPGQKDLIDANATFLRNRLRREAVSELILERLSRRLSHKWHVPIDQALEQGLAHEKEHHPHEVATLERSLESISRGEKIANLKLARQVYALEHLAF